MLIRRNTHTSRDTRKRRRCFRVLPGRLDGVVLVEEYGVEALALQPIDARPQQVVTSGDHLVASGAQGHHQVLQGHGVAGVAGAQQRVFTRPQSPSHDTGAGVGGDLCSLHGLSSTAWFSPLTTTCVPRLFESVHRRHERVFSDMSVSSPST